VSRSILIAVLALLVAATPSSAADPLPVGESKGVRVERRHGAIVVVFTKRAAHLYRRLAGKRVGVYCTELPDPEELGFTFSGSGGSSYVLPKRRRPIRTGDLTRGIDYCRLWLAPRTIRRKGDRVRLGRTLVVSVPLTQRGAVYLDEQERAVSMFFLLTLAGELGDDDANTYPTPAEFLRKLERRGLTGLSRLVALTAPSATPPSGRVGYYSDGVRHAAVVMLSASGRRLFIEVATDDLLHTNVARYLVGDLD
jgi:hypothetical protein